MKNNNLHIEEIPHSKGKFISVALSKKGYSQIPKNVILDKTLTGIGATHTEITDKMRNSIIIEPNVPVIKGKALKHQDDELELLAIYAGVSTYKIESFLKKTTKQKKKILTTPEGFVRLRRAANKWNINIYQEYFCLFDECEKITQDVGYRKRIAQPVYDFFMFKEKAFVSATPLKIKHPKVKEQGFKILKIKPDFDYKEKLDLIVTNTFIDVVQDKLNSLKSSPNICIFFNSTEGISKIIESCGIKDYKVFCSEDAKKKLLKKGIVKVEPDFGLPMAKYNFFTSRFYSAFDIELKKDKPDILILTDLDSALHSMVDPLTEAIQIQGRFRNEFEDGKRFNSLTHITTIKEKLKVFSKNQIALRIEEFKKTHKYFKKRLEDSECIDQLKAILEDLKGIKYNDLLDEYGSLNHFAVDNWYNEERVKKYYTNEDFLHKAYNETDYFDVSFESRINLYHVDTLESELKDSKGKPKVKAVIDIIEERDDMQRLKSNLRLIYPDTDIVFNAFEKLGLPVIERYNYKLSTIKKKLKQYESEERRFCPEILEEIYNEFEIGETVLQKEFAERLKPIFQRYSIGMNPIQDHINDYFTFSRNNGELATFTFKDRNRAIEKSKQKRLSHLISKWLKKNKK